MQQLSELKVMRDPIHGYIHIREKIIWDLIDTPEFQRLRRIHQLGSTYVVYHTAEHTRFGHSLGVYEIARRMIMENQDIHDSLSEYEQVVVLCAALLHDIGHGPFSHSFEPFLKQSHEVYTTEIIRHDSKVHDVLASYDPSLPQDVARVIEHSHPRKLLSQMISSQLDADRMDYLLRDAYFTGTKYGEYDLERVLRTIRVRDDKIVIKQSGIHTIEDYIMARYHMYWQVYLHPMAGSYDAILSSLFERMNEVNALDPTIMQEYPMFWPLLKDKPLTNQELLEMDESALLYGLRQIQLNAPDPIMQDLAERLLDRRLFEYHKIHNSGEIRSYMEWVAANGYNPEYYICVKETSGTPYKPYRGDSEAIWIWTDDGEINEISEVSPIVSAVIKTYEDEKRIYYPKELNQ